MHTRALDPSRLGSPGYQYAWLAEDTVLEACVGGLARLPATPMTAATTLNAYSIAKTLTAAAVVVLAERGALELDAPLTAYLGPAAPYAPAPTVRQTLAHTGGLPNPIPLAWVHRVEDDAQFDRQAFIAAVVQAHARLRFAPGTKLAYSNVGYLLLGELVERASGLPYAQFVETELIRPLALAGDAVLALAIPDLDHHANGHLARFGLTNALLGWFLDRAQFAGPSVGRWTTMRPHYANGLAYGGLIANALGLGRYLQALLRGDGALGATVRRLLLEPVTIAGRTTGRTLGWFRGRLAGHTYYHHAGGGAGYYAEARFYPELGRASVLLLNRAGLSDARALDSLDRRYLRGAPAGSTP